MVSVRGLRKSTAPRMRPPMVLRRRTDSEEEDDLLEPDSNASNQSSEVTFIQRAIEGESEDATAESNDANGSECDSTSTVPERTVPNAVGVSKATSAPKECVSESQVEVKPVSKGGAVADGKDKVEESSKVADGKKNENAPNSKLNQSTGSTDSGNGEMMDTTVKEDDGGIPGLYASISLIEENVKSNFPITARPPCTVDSSMVSYIIFMWPVCNLYSLGSRSCPTYSKSFGSRCYC